MRRTTKLSTTVLLTALALLSIPRRAPADRAVDPATSRPIERQSLDGAAGSVTLPLDDYLRLKERIELADRARQAPAEAVFAELTAQTTKLTLDGSTARVQATYRVQLTGRPSRPVKLPVTGLVKSANFEPPAREGANGRSAALHRQAGGLLLVATGPGSYTVEVESLAELEDDRGVSRLELAKSRAGLATLALDLPADVSWTCERAVVVEESSDGERRRLLLAPERGASAMLELRRAAAPGAAGVTRARAVVVSVARLGGDRFERHDVVLYEVSRGELDRFEVDLPAGLEVARATTDEGSAMPILDGRRLTVEREQRLPSAGHLVLAFPAWRLPAADTARPLPATDVPLPQVEPAVPVRARYLVLSADRAAEVRPLPAEAWRRVDFEDLPRGVRSRVAALDAGAVWRRTEAAGVPRLRVALHRPVEALDAVVRQRSTTTLLTADGALVHRDRLILDRAGAVFELSLPAAARLWSARVDGQAVRPIVRGGTLAIPLAFKVESATEIEIVSIEERRIERGARLGIDAPRVATPVIEHQWRLLLPERHRYRLAGSALQPAPAGETNPDATARVGSKVAISFVEAGAGQAGIAGRVIDESGDALPGTTVSVTGAVTRIASADADGRFAIVQLPAGSYRIAAQLDGFSSVETIASVPEGRTAEVELTLPLAAISEEITVTASMASSWAGATAAVRDEPEAAQRRRAAQRELANLRQGLVGGVKPLAVELPESGKLLLLAGALPPPEVGVELEVRVR